MVFIKKTERVTLKDIAREAGVGLGTASRVLNKNASVKEASRKAVVEAMKKMNYKPNAIARSLKTRSTRTIGVMIPDISSPFYPEVLRGIEDISILYNYNIILTNTDMNAERTKNCIEMFWEKKVDGVILISNVINDEIADELSELEVPVVLICSKDPKSAFASVTIDDEKASYKAVDYLCNLGHKKIAYISGKIEGSEVWSARFAGYKRALKKHGIKFEKEYVIEGDTRYKSGYLSMKELLMIKNRPTALFAGNDIMAMGAAKAVNEAGLGIPDDVSIIGFDGIEHTEFFYPPITTIKVQRYDMGAIGMRLLTKFLNKEEVAEKDFVTEVELLERNSTKFITNGN